MATIPVPKGVTARQNKNGTTRYYLRVTKREGRKQEVKYRPLPHLADPNFAVELAKLKAVAATDATRAVKRDFAIKERTIAALVHAFRPGLANLRSNKGNRKGQPLADGTVKSWNENLDYLVENHGHKLVADLRAAHVYEIMDTLADTPGKANIFLSKFKGLLQWGCERDWIPANPAAKIPAMPLGEMKRWPPNIIAIVLEKAVPVLRLAVISALCSGLRISDLIRMRYDWIQPDPAGGFVMVAPGSKKTDTPAFIPMHEVWLAEIERFKAVMAETNIASLTILCNASGQPFKSPRDVANKLYYLMTDLGLRKVGQKEETYSFHGLSKNAVCELTEAGLSVDEIAAIVGKTPETVRKYAKEKRDWMLSLGAAGTVRASAIGNLVNGENTSPELTKRMNQIANSN